MDDKRKSQRRYDSPCYGHRKKEPSSADTCETRTASSGPTTLDFEEELSESEQVIRNIIARHKTTTLDDFNPGIQRYQALQERLKFRSEHTKQTIKKLILAKIRRAKLTINLDIDLEVPQSTVPDWSCFSRVSVCPHSAPGRSLRPLRKTSHH